LGGSNKHNSAGENFSFPSPALVLFNFAAIHNSFKFTGINFIVSLLAREVFGWKNFYFAFITINEVVAGHKFAGWQRKRKHL